jgi:retron-type reverse transcriptase
MSVHPFLYPFGTEERWLSYLGHCLQWDETDLGRARSLLSRNLIPVVRGPEIAAYLGISPKLLGHMVVEPQKYYRAFRIKKKNGKYREITAPRVFLKTIQRYILDCILAPLDVHPAAIGFRRRLSPRDGAERHVGRKFLWNIDLKDFFPSITKRGVLELFERVGFPAKGAYFLAGLCCLNDRLPQGAPTSPAISNLIFHELDEAISKEAEGQSVTYTRYADDLSFSSDKPIPGPFRRAVSRAIGGFGFTINPDKSRLMGPRCRREVTGLTVNEKVSVPRETRRKLRARFHQAALEPKKHTADKAVLLGYAVWISQYHPRDGKRFREIAEAIPEGKPITRTGDS